MGPEDYLRAYMPYNILVKTHNKIYQSSVEGLD